MIGVALDTHISWGTSVFDHSTTTNSNTFNDLFCSLSDQHDQGSTGSIYCLIRKWTRSLLVFLGQTQLTILFFWMNLIRHLRLWPRRIRVTHDRYTGWWASDCASWQLSRLSKTINDHSFCRSRRSWRTSGRDSPSKPKSIDNLP